MDNIDNTIDFSWIRVRFHSVAVYAAPLTAAVYFIADRSETPLPSTTEKTSCSMLIDTKSAMLILRSIVEHCAKNDFPSDLFSIVQGIGVAEIAIYIRKDNELFKSTIQFASQNVVSTIPCTIAQAIVLSMENEVPLFIEYESFNYRCTS